MKKAFTVSAAAVIAAGAALICSADNSNKYSFPDDYYTYVPYCYFRTDVGESVHKLKNGTLYINLEKQPEEGVDIDIYNYYYDKYKKSQQITFKYAFDNTGITPVESINTVEKFGQVYKKVTDPQYSIFKPDPDKYPYDVISFSVQSTGPDPFVVVSNETDDYPLWGMKAHIDKHCEWGRHKFFMEDIIPGWTSSVTVLSYDDKDPETGKLIDTKIYEYHVALVTEPLNIFVSDRELGDVDKNGKVDADDAEIILTCYTTVENNHITFYTNGNFAAAEDVNADGNINEEDAEIIMDYVTSGSNVSFYDYLETLE